MEIIKNSIFVGEMHVSVYIEYPCQFAAGYLTALVILLGCFSTNVTIVSKLFYVTIIYTCILSCQIMHVECSLDAELWNGYCPSLLY